MFENKEVFQKIDKTILEYHITVEELKKQLNILDDDFDSDYLLSIIHAASDYVEQRINQDINIKSNTLNIYNTSIDSIKLFDIPFNSITSISGTTTDNQIINITDYDVELLPYAFKIYFNQNHIYNHLQINFKSGYKIENVPASLKQAILIKANDLYDTERSGYSFNVQKNDVVEILLNNYSNIRF